MPVSLAVAIPTYNRASVLEQNLLRMLPELHRQGINLYISDDSSNGETAEFIERLIPLYPNLIYKRNIPALGHDANFLQTVLMPTEDYVWYLGDALYSDEAGINRVIKAAASGDDFLFINSYADYPISGSLAADQARDLIKNLAWYLTLTGATVYGPQVKAWLRGTQDTQKFKNFVQLAAILGFFLNHAATCFWIKEETIIFNKNKKKSYWSKKTVEVFGYDWASMITSFTSIFGTKAIHEVLLSHSKKTGILGTTHLIKVRAEGGADLGTVLRYRKIMRQASTAPLWFAILIGSLPSWPFKMALNAAKWIRAGLRN